MLTEILLEGLSIATVKLIQKKRSRIKPDISLTHKVLPDKPD